MDVIARAVGLGLAGIDPLGAVLLAGAIAAGASRVKVAAFTAAVIVATVGTGVGMSLLGTSLIDRVSGAVPAEDSSFWAYLELAGAVAIVVWLARPENEGEKPARKVSGSAMAFAAAGAGFSVTSVLDPTFLATVAVVGRESNAAIVVAAHVVWLGISQAMLFALVWAYAIGRHEPLMAWGRRWWERFGSRLRKGLRSLGAAVAALLVADAVWFLVRGDWFPG